MHGSSVVCGRKWNRLLMVVVALEVNGRIAARWWRPWLWNTSGMKWNETQRNTNRNSSEFCPNGFFFNYRQVPQMMRILLYDSFGAPSGICRNFISRKEFIWKLNRNVGKILGIAFVARRPPLVLRSQASVDDCLMWMAERVRSWKPLFNFPILDIVCLCSFAFMVQLRMREKVCMQSVSNERRIRSSIQQTIFFCLFYIFILSFFIFKCRSIWPRCYCVLLFPLRVRRRWREREKYRKDNGNENRRQTNDIDCCHRTLFPIQFLLLPFFFHPCFSLHGKQ